MAKQVYRYRGQLYCINCGSNIVGELKARGRQATDSSQTWPIGPQNQREDTKEPRFCARCQVFLENTLTDTAKQELPERLTEYGWSGIRLATVVGFYGLNVSLTSCMSCATTVLTDTLENCQVATCVHAICENCLAICANCDRHACNTHRHRCQHCRDAFCSICILAHNTIEQANASSTKNVCSKTYKDRGGYSFDDDIEK